MANGPIMGVYVAQLWKCKAYSPTREPAAGDGVDKIQFNTTFPRQLLIGSGTQAGDSSVKEVPPLDEDLFVLNHQINGYTRMNLFGRKNHPNACDECI